jgi:hypothetical protein
VTARVVRRIVRVIFFGGIGLYVWIGFSAVQTMADGWPLMGGSAAVVALIVSIPLLRRHFDAGIDVKDAHVSWEDVVADDPDNPNRGGNRGKA